MTKFFVNIPPILKQAYNDELLHGVILFGSSTYKSKPNDIDLAIITSTGSFENFISLLSTNNSLSTYDISLIKQEEINPNKEFFFGGHGQYLVESLRQGIVLFGKNPFKDFAKNKVFDIKKSIINRMREYIYILRKSYFDKQAEKKFISRYDKMVLLSAFLLLKGFSYPKVLTLNQDYIETKLKKKGYLMFDDKKKNIEKIWADINKQY